MQVHLLGSGAALVSARRSNTMLAVSVGPTVLIDCSGTPMRALLAAGLGPASLTDVVLTHEHPDHLYGLVSLVHELSLVGRSSPRAPLRVLGLERAIGRASRLLEAAGLRPGAVRGLELRLDPLPLATQATVIGEATFTTFPVAHSVPALGVRLSEERAGGPPRAIVCSGDTAPTAAVIEASQGADLLFHECSSFTDAEALPGHTTLSQVPELAASTTASRIVLVHLPPVSPAAEEVVRRDLEERFGGRVALGDDGATWEL
jgi:ribonuclease Z